MVLYYKDKIDELEIFDISSDGGKIIKPMS